jgi:hypothetical protein
MTDTAIDEIAFTPAPFPHAVVDDLWDPKLLERVIGEYPSFEDSRWIRYGDAEHEEKLEGSEEMFGDATRELVGRIASLSHSLSASLSLPELVLSTEGGGYHITQPGGGLAVHADFNRGESGLYRRVNVIIYLNTDKEELDGGELELWDGGGPVERVVPKFNRTLLFETSDHSFHGHPAPLRGQNFRRSFAAYFFSEAAPDGYSGDHSTVWHPMGKRVAAA